jgi:tripartite ATP-independent transporter DctM subunit
MIMRIPIGFAFGLGAVVLLSVFKISPQWLIGGALKIKLQYPFLAMPMYLALGSIAGHSSIVDRISDLFTSIVGRIKGGLGLAVVLSCALFGAVSGSATAALAGIGSSFINPMEKKGYPREYTTSLLIASAVLSILVPPSGNMILYGFMGQLSITMCFLAPLLPGLILMTLIMIVHLVLVRKIPSVEVQEKTDFKTYNKQVFRAFRRSSLALVLPVIVLGGIYAGLYTPIESAAFGVFYALILAFFVYRNFSAKFFTEQLLNIGVMMGSIACLFLFFLIISRVFIVQQISDQMLAFFYTISDNKWFIMFCLNVILLLMGMIIDDGSATLISAVVLLPIVTQIGFDPFHFAAIVGVNLGMGLITPPVAPLLYVGEMVAGVSAERFMKRSFYYIVFAFLPALIITIALPQLSTWLPYLVRGLATGA